MILTRQLRCLVCLCGFLTLVGTAALARKKEPPPRQWSAKDPNCSFERATDGRYHWRMRYDDLDVTLLADSQELTKTQRRLYHVISLYMTVTYTGKAKFEFPGAASLQFVRHHNVLISNLDPDGFSNRMQNDMDTLSFDTQRALKKDPAKGEEKVAEAREYQKEVAEFIEFISTQSLQTAILTPGNSETHGWLFFSLKNKWIGPLKPREDLVLRVKMNERTWVFPFSLPPIEGDYVLRQRE